MYKPIQEKPVFLASQANYCALKIHSLPKRWFFIHVPWHARIAAFLDCYEFLITVTFIFKYYALRIRDINFYLFLYFSCWFWSSMCRLENENCSCLQLTSFHISATILVSLGKGRKVTCLTITIICVIFLKYRYFKSTTAHCPLPNNNCWCWICPFRLCLIMIANFVMYSSPL